VGPHAYHFVDVWRVAGTPEEAAAVIGRGDLSTWWPSGFVRSTRLTCANVDGVGTQFEMRTCGWLPYTLTWTLEVIDVSQAGFTFEARGDFCGQGTWTFADAGDDHTEVTFDWDVRIEKPSVRLLSNVVRWLFVTNHVWVMARGERSLALAIARHRRLPAAAPPPRRLFPRLAVAATASRVPNGCHRGL
jgi:hypothetical protein